MSSPAKSVAALVVLLGCLQCRVSGGDDNPLPTGDSVKAGFARRMEKSQKEKAAFEDTYRYVRNRVREERNSSGKVRVRTEERQVHTPQRAGADPHQDAGAAKYGEGDIVVGEQLLDRFVFEVVGREDLEGRSVLRVHFRPVDGDLPQEETLDRFINRIAGTLWLEESTLALLKARMALQERVNFLAGIAGVVYRLEMTAERAVTPEGLWYTRRSAWQVDYRAFLVRKIVDFEERWEEVARASSDSHSVEPASP